MGFIFALAALVQIAAGKVKRFIDWSLEASGAEYYPGFGWAIPFLPPATDVESPTEQPTEPVSDPQADYSASNAEAQATGDEYQRWLAKSDAFIESSPNYNPRMDKTC